MSIFSGATTNHIFAFLCSTVAFGGFLKIMLLMGYLATGHGRGSL